MSRDLEQILQMRSEGRAPKSVTVWVGDYEQPRRGLRWYEISAPADVHLSASEDVRLLDLRPLIRLDVQVLALRYSARLVQLSERLKEVVNTLLVAVGEDDDLDGWTWVRGREQASLFDPVATVEWCRAQRHVQLERKAAA